MTETLILYLIKSSICILFFYISFKSILSNDTFFAFNRYALLFGISICMILPFCSIKTVNAYIIQQPVYQLESLIREPITLRSEIIFPLPSIGIQKLDKPPVNWKELLMTIYLLGIAAYLTRIIISFIRLYQVCRKGERIKYKGCSLILTQNPIVPFSWGNYIVMSQFDYKSNPEEIIVHEYMHLRHHHFIDLIYIEIIILIYWFNPAIWLLKRELQDFHEYQADKGVLDSGIDATKYQLLLVKKAVGVSLYTLANSFNHSKIKKRITMMLKEKSNNWGKLKIALMIPITIGTLSAFTKSSPDHQSFDLVNKGKIIQQTKLVEKEEPVFKVRQKNVSYIIADIKVSRELFKPFKKFKTSYKKEDFTNSTMRIIRFNHVVTTADGGTIPTPSLYMELTEEGYNQLKKLLRKDIPYTIPKAQ